MLLAAQRGGEKVNCEAGKDWIQIGRVGMIAGDFGDNRVMI